jgi:hypothetical protein
MEEPVLVSEVAPVEFYTVKEETKPYEYRPLYQGTDETEAQRILSSAKDPSKVKMDKSKGLPDSGFCIDRQMGQPVYVSNHENDTNRCLLEASVVGNHSFKAYGEIEILAEHRIEGRPGTKDTRFIVIAFLHPNKRLTIEWSGLRTGNHRNDFCWDGHLLTKMPMNPSVVPASASPWNALDALKVS